jgi:hypothetical protein
MLRFGTDYYPPNRWGNDKEEKEWRWLLRESMRDLNRRAFIADCKIDHNTPDQPPHDYYAFNPDDPASVFARAYAVTRCTDASLTFAKRQRTLSAPSPR